MQLILENAEQKLASIMESIQKNPFTWDGWKCLHIEMPGMDKRKNACRVRSDIAGIFRSFFRECEGNAYFCGYDNVYFFSKNAGQEMLSEAGRMVSAVARRISRMEAHTSIWDIKSDEEENKMIAALSSLTNKARSSFGTKRVLLVEDDRNMRELVSQVLENKCELMMTTTAGQAMAAYNAFCPALVFLDINLPDKNGNVVLNHILECDPKAEVVIFSGEDDMETIMTLLEHGASGFIAKPFVRDKLLHYIAA